MLNQNLYRVVAGLVPATSILLAPPPYPPPHAGEGRVGAVAGTSPATTAGRGFKTIEIRSKETASVTDVRQSRHEQDVGRHGARNVAKLLQRFQHLAELGA